MSSCMVILGWMTLVIFYCIQVGLLVAIVAKPEHFLFFVPACILTIIFLRCGSNYTENDKDKEKRFVFYIWLTYNVVYVVEVVIFAAVVKDLPEEGALGINALKMALSITPGLLILFLQLMICPSYRKPLLYLSIVAALDIFDGIEMLEIYLMQNVRHFDFDSATEGLKDLLMQDGRHFNFSNANGTGILKDFLMRSERRFDLNSETEVCIIFFACVCFLLSSFNLVRNKFGTNGEVKERGGIWAKIGLLQVICTNFPFLVIRVLIWKNHQYKASLFIVKNVVSIMTGLVVFGGTCLVDEEDANRNN